MKTLYYKTWKPGKDAACTNVDSGRTSAKQITCILSGADQWACDLRLRVLGLRVHVSKSYIRLAL